MIYQSSMNGRERDPSFPSPRFSIDNKVACRVVPSLSLLMISFSSHVKLIKRDRDQIHPSLHATPPGVRLTLGVIRPHSANIVLEFDF